MARIRLAAALLLACLAPAAFAATAELSTCIWRNDIVCDASPGYIISQLSTLPSNPADNPLAVQALQVAAMEAACHVFTVEAECVAADACNWNNKQVPCVRVGRVCDQTALNNYGLA